MEKNLFRMCIRQDTGNDRINVIRNAYRKRLKSLKQTVSSFCVHIVLKTKIAEVFKS